MAWDNGEHCCDRCGCVLTKENNKCGYEICDKCNDYLEMFVEKQKALATGINAGGIDGGAKRQICKATADLLGKAAKLPENYEEDNGLLMPIIMGIKNAENGVDIILRNLNKICK